MPARSELPAPLLPSAVEGVAPQPSDCKKAPRRSGCHAYYEFFASNLILHSNPKRSFHA